MLRLNNFSPRSTRPTVCWEPVGRAEKKWKDRRRIPLKKSWMDVGSAFAEYFERRISVKKTWGPRALDSHQRFRIASLWLSRIFFSPCFSICLRFFFHPFFFAVVTLSLLLPVLPLSPPFCFNFFRRPLSLPLSRFPSTLSFILRCFRFAFVSSCLPCALPPVPPFPSYLFVVFPAPFRWKIGQPYTYASC